MIIEDEDSPEETFKPEIEKKEPDQHKISEPHEEVIRPKEYPPPPFPQRINKSKEKQQLKWFQEIFSKLQISIPFVEALMEMLQYVKFMKSILTKRQKLEGCQMIALTEECSAIDLHQSLPKC